MDKKNNCDERWPFLRNKHLSRFKDEMAKGLVDEDIREFLYTLNSNKCIATTSSCSGRIVVIAAKDPHDKASSSFLFKKHDKVSVFELKSLIKQAEKVPYDYIWLSVQPLIISMYVCGAHNANVIYNLFSSIGFKYTCIRRMKKLSNVYHIMIYGTERLDIPIIFKRTLLINDSAEALERLALLVNTFISFTKNKLEKLKRTAHIVNMMVSC
ncbi:MAG: hypothetical protein ABWW69_04700 [Pyrodictiaceae archaeon]